uniref:putative neuroblastoma breakpoint family member 5 n=1 Tax=Macaca mulatta TaxID=9544 RepID=UPI0010A22F02
MTRAGIYMAGTCHTNIYKTENSHLSNIKPWLLSGRELTQLREKLQEERCLPLLNQHFKALLTPDDLEKSQENDEDEDEDEMDEEVEKVQESPAPREVQKAEEKEVPQNSLEECAVTCSNSHNPSNSNQPHRSTKITFEENKVDSALVVESERIHHEEEEALNILP